MDVNHIHKIASWQHLDECLVNHWRLSLPCWHRRLTITVPVKLFPLKNLSIYIVITVFCSPLGFAVNYVICGDQNKWGLLMCDHDRLYGKRGYVLEILKCSKPFPDLWSSGVWGLMQAWAGRTTSVFWSLSIPSLVSGVRGLSNVSVCCFLLQVVYILQDWWLADWWVIPGLSQSAVKYIWSLTFPQAGGRWRLFSLFFWPSSNFLKEK